MIRLRTGSARFAVLHLLLNGAVLDLHIDGRAIFSFRQGLFKFRQLLRCVFKLILQVANLLSYAIVLFRAIGGGFFTGSGCTTPWRSLKSFS